MSTPLEIHRHARRGRAGGPRRPRPLRSLAVALALAAVAGLGAGRPAAAGAEDPAELLAALESPVPRDRAEAYTRLAERGPEAARAALEGFRESSARGRRARSLLLRRLGEAEDLERTYACLEDPDPEVRANLYAFLGRADLGDVAAERRARELGRAARRETVPELVDAAVDALATIPSAAAGAALDGLVDDLAGPSRARAARALRGTAHGRAAILRRVRRFAATGEGAPDALAVLVSDYGRVLADELSLAPEARDLVPLVAALRHADDRVRVGALQGVELLIARQNQLGDRTRSQAVLDRLEGLGWDPQEVAYRRATLALRGTAAPGAALEPARELARRAATRQDVDGRTWRFFGHYLEAAAQLATGQPEHALEPLEAAAAVLAGLRAERVDLRPLLENPSERQATLAVDTIRQQALVELMHVVRLLLAGAEGDAELTAHARRAHLHLLEAQYWAASYRAEVSTDVDFALDHDLGPRRLLFENPRNAAWSRDEAIDLLRRLGDALRRVAPTELPGFSAPGAERRDHPLADEERFQLLLDAQTAERERLRYDYERLFRERPALWQARARVLILRMDDIEQKLLAAEEALAEGTPREEAYAFLLDLRTPSSMALWLSRELRAEGDVDAARELSRAMADDLEAAGLASDLPWLDAEVGMAHAATFTEAREPERAEEALLEVLAKLEALENTLESSLEAAESAANHELASTRRRQLRRTRDLRSDCLVSLAVNANVRLRDPERALGYFERAYELRQNDFMRVLLACYRSRSGHAEEARILLREVPPAPDLYYNMACTYALMGEAGLALDFLRKDFEENHASPGSLERQREWAREDPDLASLRGLAGFEALVGRAGD